MQVQKYSIKEWAKDDRPREKLLSKSPQSLSDSELLAILIRTGTRKGSALDLAKDVMRMGRNNLQELGKHSVQELMQISGIGEAKAATIAAALELGRRRQAAPLLGRDVIREFWEVPAYLQAISRDLGYEVFGAIFLNRAGKVKRLEIMSRGGITATVADPRLILKMALEEEAVSIILFHNHPSGSLVPSAADKDLTLKIRDAANLLDIKLLDHYIVSEEGHFSFAKKGLI